MLVFLEIQSVPTKYERNYLFEFGSVCFNSGVLFRSPFFD